MRLEHFYATRRARGHMLSKHQVEWHEVVEVMEQNLPPRRIRSAGAPRRYYVVGRTPAGRRLKVIFELEAQRRARIITAYQPRS